jgi:hypothetical protein
MRRWLKIIENWIEGKPSQKGSLDSNTPDDGLISENWETQIEQFLNGK